MLLILRSLWEQQASGAVVVTGEGVSANPAVGTGDVITTARGGSKRRRRRTPRYREPYWQPVRLPAVPITVTGEGVECRPRVGTGNVLIEVDFSDEELVAILLMGSDETEAARKIKKLSYAVQSAYSRDALTAA